MKKTKVRIVRKKCMTVEDVLDGLEPKGYVPFTLRPPTDMFNWLQKTAKAKGISINGFIVLTLSKIQKNKAKPRPRA